MYTSIYIATSLYTVEPEKSQENQERFPTLVTQKKKIYINIYTIYTVEPEKSQENQ